MIEWIGFVIRSMLYVSIQAFAAADSERTINQIVAISRRRNARVGVSGVLIATERHFAQVIEGPADTVNPLMAAIRCDARHHHVTVLHAEDLSARRFGNWSLAYRGRSAYLDHYVAPLIAPHVASSRDALRLIELMERVATDTELDVS